MNETLATALKHHVAADPTEAAHVARILEFMAHHRDPFDRQIREGHLTGSAFLVSADETRVLLVFHRKLSRWLQPGGHGASGEHDGLTTALRETAEETHLADLSLHPAAPRPFDVDVHTIPAHGAEPEHLHFDLRYLLIAPPGAVPHHDPEESLGLRWFKWAELESIEADSGMCRALRKVQALLRR